TQVLGCLRYEVRRARLERLHVATVAQREPRRSSQGRVRSADEMVDEVQRDLTPLRRRQALGGCAVPEDTPELRGERRAVEEDLGACCVLVLLRERRTPRWAKHVRRRIRHMAYQTSIRLGHHHQVYARLGPDVARPGQ